MSVFYWCSVLGVVVIACECDRGYTGCPRRNGPPCSTTGMNIMYVYRCDQVRLSELVIDLYISSVICWGVPTAQRWVLSATFRSYEGDMLTFRVVLKYFGCWLFLHALLMLVWCHIVRTTHVPCVTTSSLAMYGQKLLPTWRDSILRYFDFSAILCPIYHRFRRNFLWACLKFHFRGF